MFMTFHEYDSHMDEAAICRDLSFHPFKCLLLDMSQERSIDALLRLIVERLRDVEDAALARIWLIDRGDICDECHLRRECPDQTKCLHLVASAGKPLEKNANWDGLDGRFRRFPIGVRKVGHIAATAGPVEVNDIDAGAEWIADPAWAQREQVRTFVGQPLLYQDDVLGVLGVFLRGPVMPEGLFWLRMIADHAASAITNARAFEQIDRLRGQLELENEYLRDEVKAAHDFGQIIGRSDALNKVLEQVELVAPTDTSVLILGESGVGKELIARAIHDHSPRARGPLITVNCASIPQELFESEFFGHVKGSFTGAIRDRVGRFEMAGGGTLLLDEVGEIPLDMQSKLLRVLQEGAFERIGEEQTRTADVRIVAATNRRFEEEVEAKRFRQDLYYRLSVFPIEVLALRDRKEDIGQLASHFLDLHSRRLGIDPPTLKNRHIAELEGYDWPGNIRELQNVIERAVIRSRVGPLEFDLPGNGPAGSASSAGSAAQNAGGAGDPSPGELMTLEQIDQLQRDNIVAVLEKHNWKISGQNGAAEFLGVHPATLSSRLRSMGIKRPG